MSQDLDQLAGIHLVSSLAADHIIWSGYTDNSLNKIQAVI